MLLRKLTLLVLGFILLSGPVHSAASDTSGSGIFSPRDYFLKDYQYFRPMIANLRTSQNHVRSYLAKGVKFSNSDEPSKHWFFDPGFGGYFPFWGYNFADISDSTIPMHLPGIVAFIDGSAHLLLDMHTESRDVINTDYRLGGGLALRVPTVGWLPFGVSFRWRIFHESTHIGDEYTLFASKQPEFRRYNVSYEANEIYISIDRNMSKYDKEIKQLVNNSSIAYMRIYAGLRRLSTDEYEGFTGLFEPSESIVLSSRYEQEGGAEIYFRLSDPPDKRSGADAFSRLISPQNIVVAADISRNDQFDIVASRKTWSRNIVIGFVYGDFMGIEKPNSVRWQFSYYKGVNPHGQFRTEITEYFALDYVIDF